MKRNHLRHAWLLAMSVLFLAACKKDKEPQPIVDPTGYSAGVLVLSEGNMANATGKLAHIDHLGNYTDSIYYKANLRIVNNDVQKRYLGNVSQDLFISDGKAYIISQNGEKNGGDGILVITHLRTMRALDVYKQSDLAELKHPTHIAVVGQTAYIRDNKGIYALNLESRKLSFVEGTDGAQSRRFAVLGQTVFALAGKRVLALMRGKVAQSTELEHTPNSIVRATDNKLFVSTEDKRFLRMRPDLTIESEQTLSTSSGADSWGNGNVFAASGDTIYFANGKEENDKFLLYRHLYAQNKTELVVDIRKHKPLGTQYYNSIAVDPSTGLVYFATAEWGGAFLQENSLLVFDPARAYNLVRRFDSRMAFTAGVYPIAAF